MRGRGDAAAREQSGSRRCWVDLTYPPTPPRHAAPASPPLHSPLDPTRPPPAPPVLPSNPSRSCRRGANLYHTQFSDAAPADFPVNASGAPFTGAYRPTQKLAFLSGGQQPVAGEGGSQGLWTLNISDLAPNPDRFVRRVCVW